MLASAFRDLLREAENRLQHIATLHAIVDTIATRLDTATRKKEFRIWGRAAWTIALDTRDMDIIRFASWSKGLLSQGGLFGQIQAHHLAQLRPKPPAPCDQDDYLRERAQKAHAEAFKRLFPNNPGRPARPQDIAELQDRFAASTKAVRDDRNDNRAHPFEDRSSATTSMLATYEVGALIGLAAELLDDLHFVALQEQVTGSYPVARQPDIAADIVDAILLGGKQRQHVVLNGKSPEEAYAEMHAWHDSLPAPGALFFNDNPPRT